MPTYNASESQLSLANLNLFVSKIEIAKHRKHRRKQKHIAKNIDFFALSKVEGIL